MGCHPLEPDPRVLVTSRYWSGREESVLDRDCNNIGFRDECVDEIMLLARESGLLAETTAMHVEQEREFLGRVSGFG